MSYSHPEVKRYLVRTSTGTGSTTWRKLLQDAKQRFAMLGWDKGEKW